MRPIGALLLTGTLAATLATGALAAPTAQAAPAASALETTTEKAESASPKKGATTTARPYDRILDDLLEHEPVGGVLHATTATGEVETARGLADKRSERAAKPHDRYRVGSNTKTMTAVVVLQLVQEGRLSLDDSVAEILPRFDLDERITVRHLLQHTSGFSQDTMLWKHDSDYEKYRFRYLSPDELVRTALTHPDPRPDPGTAWEYSNTNYVLAGLVVRQITGNRMHDEVRDRIIRPLRLRDTAFPVTHPFVLGPHLRGYYLDGRDTTTYSMSYAWSAGNVVSTAEDQTRFLRALLDGELLDRETLRVMLDPGEFGYGLGILPVELPCGGMAYGHDGAVFGYQSANFATTDGRSAAIGVNAWILDDQTGALSPAVARAATQALCVQPAER